MSVPRALSHCCFAFALILAGFSTGAAQESGDSAVAAARSGSPFAAAGARTIRIYPDSLPDVPRTMSELLAMGAPGVFVQHSSGATAAGAWISIRDGAAVRAAEPLVVIDGVRTASFVPRFAQQTEAHSPSRLDEIPVEDVERVDILAGPAAAARYGREARAGVIEITTRRPGTGAPAVRLSVSGLGTASGDAFPRNSTRIASGGAICPANDTSTACASAQPSTYTPLLDASPFRTEATREAHLGLTGGFARTGYALSLAHAAGGGVLDADRTENNVAGARFATPIGAWARLAVVSRATFRGARIPFEGSRSIVVSGLAGAIDCSPAAPCQYGDTISHGYGGTPPEELARRGMGHDVQHFTNGATLTATPRSWLALRSTASTDAFADHGGYQYSWTSNGALFTQRTQRRERAVRNTLAQEAVVRRALGAWDLAATLEARGDHERARLYTFDSTGSGGLYSFMWAKGQPAQRRQTLTLSPRLSDSRASLGAALTSTRTRLEGIGAKTPATLDGAGDLAVTLLDQPEAGPVRGLVLRAAAAQVTAYEFSNGVDFDTPVVLGFVQNGGSIRPDRTYEGEAGTDVALGPAATRLSVSAFRRRETYRSMYLPSSYASYFTAVPLRRVVNGVELAMRMVPLASDAARLETSLAFTIQNDRVLSAFPYDAWYGSYIGSGSPEISRGHSFGAWRAMHYTAADSNGNGVLDSGEIQVGEMSYTGRSRPSRFGSLDARLAIARRWTFGADIGYQGGYKVLDKVETIRCRYRICGAWQGTSFDDYVHRLTPGSASYFVSGEALRVRELSLEYGVPRLARLTRADAMHVTLAARNVATFSHARYLDPETELPAPGIGSAVGGPGLALPRTLSIRLAATY